MNGNLAVSARRFQSGVTEGTELLAEKHNFFEWKEFQKRKLLQMNGRKEKTPVKHSRETFFDANFGEL